MGQPLHWSRFFWYLCILFSFFISNFQRIREFHRKMSNGCMHNPKTKSKPNEQINEQVSTRPNLGKLKTVHPAKVKAVKFLFGIFIVCIGSCLQKGKEFPVRHFQEIWAFSSSLLLWTTKLFPAKREPFGCPLWSNVLGTISRHYAIFPSCRKVHRQAVAESFPLIQLFCVETENPSSACLAGDGSGCYRPITPCPSLETLKL